MDKMFKIRWAKTY